MLSFPTQNTASHLRTAPLPSLALLLSIVLNSTARIVSWEPTNGTRHNDTECFPKLASLLSLVRGSSADNADVNSNEHSVVFRAMTNCDLCDFLRPFCGFLPHQPQINGRQHKCYQMQYFACTLQHKFQYSYITAASTLYCIYIIIYNFNCIA